MKKQVKLTIEKNIPVPPPGGEFRGSRYADVFSKMKVGDSVVLSNQKDVNNLKALIHSRGLRPVQRKLKDGTIRVWMLDLRVEE